MFPFVTLLLANGPLLLLLLFLICAPLELPERINSFLLPDLARLKTKPKLDCQPAMLLKQQQLLQRFKFPSLRRLRRRLLDNFFTTIEQLLFLLYLSTTKSPSSPLCICIWSSHLLTHLPGLPLKPATCKRQTNKLLNNKQQ